MLVTSLPMWYACSAFGFKCFSAQFVVNWPLNFYIVFGVYKLLDMDCDTYMSTYLKTVVSPLLILVWMRWDLELML